MCSASVVIPWIGLVPSLDIIGIRGWTRTTANPAPSGVYLARGRG
jgi:hypothetical protein